MSEIGIRKRKGRTTWFYRVDVGRNTLGKRVQKQMGGFRTRCETERAMRELMRGPHSGT